MDGKRLKRLLDLKRRLEKVKKGELAEARQELERAQGDLDAAQREHNERVRDLHGEQELSVDELQDRARFVVLAGQRVGLARAQVEHRDALVNQREHARIGATRDVRTFELLSDRRKEELRIVEKRLEQGAADEVAGSRRSRS